MLLQPQPQQYSRTSSLPFNIFSGTIIKSERVALSYFTHFLQMRNLSTAVEVQLWNLLSSKLCFDLTLIFSHLHEVDIGKTEERKLRPTFILIWVQVYTYTDNMSRVTMLHLAGHRIYPICPPCKTAAKHFLSEFGITHCKNRLQEF